MWVIAMVHYNDSFWIFIMNLFPAIFNVALAYFIIIIQKNITEWLVILNKLFKRKFINFVTVSIFIALTEGTDFLSKFSM